MELEVDIEKMFPTIDQLGNTTHQNSLLEIIENETFSEEESFSFQSVVFDKESKKLIFEKGDMKIKKGKLHSEVDLKDMWPSQIFKIHRETRDVVDDFIGVIEAEKTKLKERIRELEDALMPLVYPKICFGLKMVFNTSIPPKETLCAIVTFKDNGRGHSYYGLCPCKSIIWLPSEGFYLSM
jgi:hypothetical protein